MYFASMSILQKFFRLKGVNTKLQIISIGKAGICCKGGLIVRKEILLRGSEV